MTKGELKKHRAEAKQWLVYWLGNMKVGGEIEERRRGYAAQYASIYLALTKIIEEEKP